MSDTEFEYELPSGITAERLDSVARRSWPKDTGYDVTISTGSAGVADPVTVALVSFGSMVARDCWVRYVRPKLDEAFGVGVVKERPAKTSSKKKPDSGSGAESPNAPDGAEK